MRLCVLPRTQTAKIRSYTSINEKKEVKRTMVTPRETVRVFSIQALQEHNIGDEKAYVQAAEEMILHQSKYSSTREASSNFSFCTFR